MKEIKNSKTIDAKNNFHPALKKSLELTTVSYTHLTLPTTPYV